MEGGLWKEKQKKKLKHGRDRTSEMVESLTLQRCMPIWNNDIHEIFSGEPFIDQIVQSRTK